MKEKITKAIGYGIILPILYFSNGDIQIPQNNLNEKGIVSIIQSKNQVNNSLDNLFCSGGSSNEDSEGSSSRGGSSGTRRRTYEGSQSLITSYKTNNIV